MFVYLKLTYATKQLTLFESLLHIYFNVLIPSKFLLLLCCRFIQLNPRSHSAVDIGYVLILTIKVHCLIQLGIVLVESKLLNSA